MSRRTKAGKRRFYYCLIDGTLSGDSAVFGRRLETSGPGGWSNLLDFLPLVGDSQFGFDAGRLNPGPHLPFLPVYQVPFNALGGDPKSRSQTVPVLMPNGFQGEGRDVFWRAYSEGETGDAKIARVDWAGVGGPITYGRHTAAERSCEFVNSFFFRFPGVEVPPATGGQPQGQIIDWGKHLIPEPGQAQFYADLLYVSSHGYQGGYAEGDQLRSFPSAVPKTVPNNDGFSPTEGFITPHHKYFLVGDLAQRDDGFFGPKWIVLALCSAVNPGTWPLWVQVFEKSFPWVRGLLAYEKSAPGDGPGIANGFFNRLSAGQTFLDAWKGANGTNSWAAIVHDDALDDTLVNFESLKPLREIVTTKTTGFYRGYSNTLPPGGGEVRFSDPPFNMTLFSEFMNLEAKPDTMDRMRLLSNQSFRITVSSSDGSPIERVVLRWINIRDDYPNQPNYDKVFEDPTVQTAGAKASINSANRKQFILEPEAGQTVTEIVAFCRSRTFPELQAAHVTDGYLYLLVELKAQGSPAITHHFTTNGLPS